MNRGHLVGYQFCGINNDGRNLVPETAWFNQGDYNQENSNNQSSMLWFEDRLAQFLKDNPSDWLDYQVTPLYNGNNLIPDEIELQYVGLTGNGQNIIPINFGNSLESTSSSGITKAILKNISPNAIINYQTGTAVQN
jgi:DNA-entry nuclease